jgi:hypothetical protein
LHGLPPLTYPLRQAKKGQNMALTGPGQDAIIKGLDRIIRECVPDAVRVSKYGGTLYTLHPDQKDGQFCGIFAYKDHVQFSF